MTKTDINVQSTDSVFGKQVPTLPGSQQTPRGTHITVRKRGQVVAEMDSNQLYHTIQASSWHLPGFKEPKVPKLSYQIPVRPAEFQLKKGLMRICMSVLLPRVLVIWMSVYENL